MVKASALPRSDLYILTDPGSILIVAFIFIIYWSHWHSVLASFGKASARFDSRAQRFEGVLFWAGAIASVLRNGDALLILPVDI